MPRSKSDVWKHFVEFQAGNPKPKEHGRCRYCSMEYVTNITRFKAHLVKHCLHCPAEVKARYMDEVLQGIFATKKWLSTAATHAVERDLPDDDVVLTPAAEASGTSRESRQPEADDLVGSESQRSDVVASPSVRLIDASPSVTPFASPALSQGVVTTPGNKVCLKYLWQYYYNIIIMYNMKVVVNLLSLTVITCICNDRD